MLRIAASRGFLRSTLLRNFLLFVCQRALTGESATINEQAIGVHVFGRTEQFNRADDNIVRNYARMLRKRIEDYFVQDGRDEPIRLHVPRGGYVPVFAPRESEAADPVETTHAAESPQTVPFLAVAEESIAQHASLPLPQRATTRLSAWLVVAIVLLSVSGGFALARLVSFHSLRLQSATERTSHIFWKSLFADDRDTFIVPSDGGLVILHRFLEGPTNLNDYISGAYRRPLVISQGLQKLLPSTPALELPALSLRVEALGDRRYTSIVDLDLSSHLSHQREVVPQRLLIRYARELRMDDLKSSNAILIGSVDSNPWVELFQPQLNFQFNNGGSFGGSETIVNRHPLAGEAATYANVPGDPAQSTYGVIAYLPNLSGTGRVLLVEGINMAGTQAAGEFLLDASAMLPVLRHAMNSQGELGSFEVLLQTNSIAANSSQAKILSERVTKR